MVALSKTLADLSAPPLAPADEPIDLDHLSRITLGDQSLECEILALFDRQASLMMARLGGALPSAAAAAAAHTLKGSALGIGAGRVADAAAAVEIAGAAGFPAAVEALSLAVDEAKSVIADLLDAR